MSFGDGNLHDRVAKLERENERLRTLARDMLLVWSMDNPNAGKCQIHYRGGDWRSFGERMRELDA